MKRILYVCPSSGIGGAETFIKQTLTKANKDQFQNHYLLFRTGPLFNFLQQNGARTHILKSPPKLSKWGDHKQVRSQLKDLINENNIDLVHSTMAYGALFSAWTCKQMNVPHVWFQHGPASGWMDRLASIFPHDGLIVNSHYTGKKQRQLENPLRFLIPRSIPIEKILLGTDIQTPSEQARSQYRSDLLSRHGLDKDSTIISMLCRLQSWKGVHLLLQALTQLKSQNLKGFHCFIWGEAFKGTEYLKQLEQEIKSQQLPAKLMGAADNVPLALAATDIIINASIQPEPFGLSIIEGMMLGAIPLVPDEGGPIEIVSNGKDGLIFKARDSHSLAKNLKTLLLDPELRQKLSQEAKIAAQNKYNASRAIGHLESFYDKVL